MTKGQTIPITYVIFAYISCEPQYPCALTHYGHEHRITGGERYSRGRHWRGEPVQLQLISKCVLSLNDKLDQHPRPGLMGSLSDNKGFSGQGTEEQAVKPPELRTVQPHAG